MRGAPIVLTAAGVASAVGGTVVAGDAGAPIAGVSIDSRTLEPGELFFAIVAARDGHEFVTKALEKGAAGAVVGPGFQWRNLSTFSSAAIIQVQDTTKALQELGRFVRRQSGATVVAITGSAGKTTTKEAIAAFLESAFRVVKNPGNLNNHLGLPISLVELRHGADVAVMELGMNHPGEIRLLVDIAAPDVRVWLNVGDAHLGHFPSREAIADAKAEILEGAGPDTRLVCNADDPLVTTRVGGFAGRVVTFGTSEAADVRAGTIELLGVRGSRFRLHARGEEADVTLSLLGRGNVSNVLAASAVAVELGIPLSEIVARARTLTPAPHRGAVLRLPDGITVIDDSYNSSPAALGQALEVVAAESDARRKAAVLGEMLELGDHSRRLHEECGIAAARAKLDRLIAVGGEHARALADAARRAGLPAEAVSWVPTSAAAADMLLPWLAPGDLVLVKGSRGIGTELVVDRLAEVGAR